MTTGQAIVAFLTAQYTERDGVAQRFVDGCYGIFGHGNVAGLGIALKERQDALPYYLSRNEQAMVHSAAAYARARRRLSTLACTSSVGPGATNMVTAAAGATINRLPVLLLPGDVFATRTPRPVLQQLEDFGDGNVSVNDTLRPVSRYFDRVERAEQLPHALLEALRVLTDPAETGAVTIALPQDVQAEAHDFPASLFAERVWRVPRPEPAERELREAADLLRGAQRPLIVAGGGVIYSDATDALARFARRTGVPVAATQAGLSALPADHPAAVGALGVTGTDAANELAREADVVVGIGTRYSDFTTASQTIFADPDVRFVNVNVAAPDARKFSAVPLVADARAAIEALDRALEGWAIGDEHRAEVGRRKAAWEEALAASLKGDGGVLTQPQVIAAVNEAAGRDGVVINAAGSMPGQLHRVWRPGEPGTYHVEYGYSCMGYEIPAGIGVRLAEPEREVFVLIGDGSYLMLPGELVVALQESLDLTLVLVDNHGFGSIGALSGAVGAEGFGTRYRRRDPATGDYTGERLPVDLAANAESLGARVWRVGTTDELRAALAEAANVTGVRVVYVAAEPGDVPGGAWWDVPVAQQSDEPGVTAARADYEQRRPDVRSHAEPARTTRAGSPR
ncbi:3D-(3,5/4)-trihydroxycyclohexane-1,2-dione acylhydrolase (decyclizing) [Egibacter rhizosphaerae]|uniref:3D-(3,5/4)-trihydroxycyclohexane-1,2-dione acylhydrolase (Decyclizing) n=1 Tax=Egibacter rhizosphaerae TaxID=1670831 RepID=A0A411YLA5_9ACTN|nr:3D-(3,5/4)-trihydroxycyclohexane-1,2-dione acylhydrolase (decyclizing) [Egibacter rhizosphaerae]